MLIPTMKPTDFPKSEKPAEKLENEVIPAPAKVEEKIDFSNVEIEPLFADYVDFDTLAGLPCARWSMPGWWYLENWSAT